MTHMKIGSRAIIFSNTFLIPTGEEAFFSCKIDETDQLNGLISFKIEEPEESTSKDSEDNKKKQPILSVDFKDDIFHFEFLNHTSSLGSSFAEPLSFAESDNGKEITLMAFIQKRNGMMQLHLQIMLES